MRSEGAVLIHAKLEQWVHSQDQCGVKSFRTVDAREGVAMLVERTLTADDRIEVSRALHSLEWRGAITRVSSRLQQWTINITRTAPRSPALKESVVRTSRRVVVSYPRNVLISRQRAAELSAVLSALHMEQSTYLEQAWERAVPGGVLLYETPWDGTPANQNDSVNISIPASLKERMDEFKKEYGVRCTPQVRRALAAALAVDYLKWIPKYKSPATGLLAIAEAMESV